jgi:tyrosyl-tRNA synthetase
LHFYTGIDPTANYVHIGHSTNYLILERLHALGHRITVLVGDFTAMIGDPSDKSSERIQLSRAEVEENLKTFRAQIGQILNLDCPENPIDFRFNSEWLAALNFSDAVALAGNFTVQQMLERSTFRTRVAEKKPLYLHELLYPLMQGYDSVSLEVDGELGGMDQKFNMLAGRTLLRRYRDKEKFAIMSTLLVNPKTGEKLMSKSLGTGIALNDPPQEMFFKIMRLPDEGVIQCFIDCTRLSLSAISDIQAELEQGRNPKDVKLRLGVEIVTMYHGVLAATDAHAAWLRQVSGGGLPAEILPWETKSGVLNLVDWLRSIGRAASKGEARRLIAGGGVRLNDIKQSSEVVSVKDGDILRAGKDVFYKIHLTGS